MCKISTYAIIVFEFNDLTLLDCFCFIRKTRSAKSVWMKSVYFEFEREINLYEWVIFGYPNKNENCIIFVHTRGYNFDMNKPYNHS